MKKSQFIILLIIVISFIITLYSHPYLPQKIVSHWDIDGNPDAYLHKNYALSILPLTLIIIFALYIIIPKIDPLKSNIKDFIKYYNKFIILLSLFLLWIHIYMILWNSGIKFNITLALSPGFAVLFYYIGILMDNAKQNWFIGIRTPWTLCNETVWKKTHRLGAKLFKGCGVIALAGILFPNYTFFIILIPIIFTAIYTIIYSYYCYQKQTNQN